MVPLPFLPPDAPASARSRPDGAAPQSGRALDVALALAGLVLLAPVVLAIALAILAETGRPVLFVQRRIGQGGRVFGMYKFRKFGPAEGSAGCPLTLERDPRLTRVGRILAETKLDELPQLLNVLRGDMAVVGPRPESLAFADCFAGRHRALLRHRPGIVGPSQVAFRSEARHYPAEGDPAAFYRRVLFPAKAAIDAAYYDRRSLGGDLAWIARAVAVVLRPATAPRRAPAAPPARRAIAVRAAPPRAVLVRRSATARARR